MDVTKIVPVWEMVVATKLGDFNSDVSGRSTVRAAASRIPLSL